MYRPGRTSHQKSLAVSEGFGCGKFEFARPFTSLYGSSRPSSPIRHHVHRGKVPGNLSTKDYEPATTNHSPATSAKLYKFSSQKLHILLILSGLSVLV